MKKASTNAILESAYSINGSVEFPQAEKLTTDMATKIINIGNISRAEIRTLVDTFYQLQDDRKAKTEQIRSILSEADKTGENKDEVVAILNHVVKQMAAMESGIKRSLEVVCQKNEVGRWLLSIRGIGPVLAAGCLAYFDVNGRDYSSQFISYAGLNDNNRPWLGSEKSKKLVNEVVEEMGEGKNPVITDEMVMEIARRSKWTYKYLLGRCYDQEKKKWSKDKLTKSIAIPPYNKSAKTFMWKVGQSFYYLTADQESMYGRLYAERKIYETQKNEDGEYADIAAECLATKNYSKSTEAYKAYISGKLPKAHIDARAKRWVEKIFLSHLFEEMYRVEYNKIPPRYYALEHLDGHHKEIAPEVPYHVVPGEEGSTTFDPKDTSPLFYEDSIINFKDKKSKKEDE